MNLTNPVSLSCQRMPPSSGKSSLSLKDPALTQFHQFFNGRTYQYQATVQTARGPQELQFPIPVVSFFKEIVTALQAKSIQGKGCFLKGGVVETILQQRISVLSDLDVNICLGQTSNWNGIERAVFQALENLSGCTGLDNKKPESPFLCPGALNNRLLVTNRTNAFSLYTLPTIYQGKTQCIDLQMLVASQTPCLFSCDALQIDMTPLIEGTENPISVVTVGGYDLEETVRLTSQRKFIGKNTELLRESLRGFCRTLARGYYTEDLSLERTVWHSFVQEYRGRFETVEKALQNYLEKHYEHDCSRKIFFLLNYYGIFSRCTEEESDPSSCLCITPSEKKCLETILFKLLYQIAELPAPSNARDELEAIYAFFYQGRRRIYENQAQQRVVVSGADFQFLLIKPVLPIVGPLPHYPLLQFLTERYKNIWSELFTKWESESPQSAASALIQALEDASLPPIPVEFEKKIGALALQLFSLKNPKVAFAFYQKCEPLLFKSPDFLKIYVPFLSCAFQLSGKEVKAKMNRGLQWLCAQSEIDDLAIEALDLLARHRQVLIKLQTDLFLQLEGSIQSLAKKTEKTAHILGVMKSLKKKDEKSSACQRGNAFFQEEKFKQALVEFKQITDPDEDLLSQMSYCCVRAGDSNNSIFYMQKAIHKNPNRHTYWLHLAKLYHSAGRQAEAIKTIQKARQRFQGNAEILDCLQQLRVK